MTKDPGRLAAAVTGPGSRTGRANRYNSNCHAHHILAAPLGMRARGRPDPRLRRVAMACRGRAAHHTGRVRSSAIYDSALPAGRRPLQSCRDMPAAGPCRIYLDVHRKRPYFDSMGPMRISCSSSAPLPMGSGTAGPSLRRSSSARRLRSNTSAASALTNWVGSGSVAVLEANATRFETRDPPHGKLTDESLNVPLAQDLEGRILTSSAVGLSRWHRDAWQDFTTANGIPDGGISALLVSRDGQVWLGLRGGGMLRWPGYGHFDRS